MAMVLPLTGTLWAFSLRSRAEGLALDFVPGSRAHWRTKPLLFRV